MAKLIVKQPFFEELEENKQENKEENKQEIQENKEEQEKPIIESTSQQSEETHGGNESTNAIQDSPNPSKEEENNSKQNGLNEQSNLQNSKENEIKQNTNEYNTEQNTNQNSNNSEQDGENTNNEQNDNSIQSGNSDQQINSNNNSNSEVTNEQNNTENNNENSNIQSDEQNNNTKNENKDTEEAEETNENEYEENNEDEDNENNKQMPSGQYNTEQVVDLTESISVYAKYYQTEFYRFLEMFAEEKMKMFDNKQPEEYNIKKLMLRKYERKSLNYYKGNKIKDTVILILDNSGSMEWWSRNLGILSLIALQRNDIQIYIAPNGEIQHIITKHYDYIPVDHMQVFKSLVNKKIIYVGDYDGADIPIELSWHNDVIWICPETRYRKFLSHSWVNYSEDRFNGVFIRAYDLNEMFQGLKKITRYSKLFIDFHINDEFQDD